MLLELSQWNIASSDGPLRNQERLANVFWGFYSAIQAKPRVNDDSWVVFRGVV
jgi:hypothetical protein